MLDRVLLAVTRAPSGPTMRAWSAAAVLVARHVERVANNAAEIGARVRFLVTGETAPVDGELLDRSDRGVADSIRSVTLRFRATAESMPTAVKALIALHHFSSQ